MFILIFSHILFTDGLPGAWFWRNLRRQLLHLLMLLLLLLLLANHVTVMAVEVGWRGRQRVTLIGRLDRGMILIGRLPRRLNGSSIRKEKLSDNFRESKFTIRMKQSVK
jgi:hypothetical protein